MIEVEGLQKSFGPVPALQPLDARFGRGRVTAIVGPNGSGKSTLIRCLLGLARPDAGVVRLDGTPVGTDPAYRARIGYMPQSPAFPENLRVRELVNLLDDLRSEWSAGPGSEPIGPDRFSERLAVDGLLDRRAGDLSGGMKQRVSAVLAFRYAPDILVLDEPTAGLDPVARVFLKERVREARAAGRTVLVTSHILTELEDLADDLLFLVDGRKRFAGEVSELLRRTGSRRLEEAVVKLMEKTGGGPSGGARTDGPDAASDPGSRLEAV
ncbi:MAG: ABC transporter ATP-binding protein [Gemmatimonadota bacterium]|nr:ABC transporter ATP-binding protein [Gemmatimonadota bacterium]